MPFIDVKTNVRLSDGQKEKLKSEFGKAVAILGKPESYLMVGICDGYDLYFAGKKLEKGAYLSVSCFGNVNAASSEKMTAKLCSVLQETIGVEGDHVYITYHGVENWGFDGANF